uniref:Uncharacterized protein n=1 Tax=Tanacetum cinerariifolium TaxID=118510 RepID=A0A6L2J7J1_TANCI|nr:hypothetical protein [Tanacetum cinerariifolium]
MSETVPPIPPPLGTSSGSTAHGGPSDTRDTKISTLRLKFNALKSLEDEGTTRIKAFMVIAEDDPSIGKADERSGQWVDITMKKVHRLLSMIDGDERKHVLDYTHFDLYYVEDQRKNLVNKFNLLKQELSLHKS